MSAIGVPVVRPSYTPERISTRSSSRRCVTCLEVPGLRRSRSGWMSASVSSIPGGQPSITHPIAGPWDSPKVVTVKRVPRVLPDMVMRVYCIPCSGDRSRGCKLEVTFCDLKRMPRAHLVSFAHVKLAPGRKCIMGKAVPYGTGTPSPGRILTVRGKRVILDADLGELYGVTTKRLNEQVRRNRDRFPLTLLSSSHLPNGRS